MVAQTEIHTWGSDQEIAGLRPAWTSRAGPPGVKKKKRETSWRVRAESQLLSFPPLEFIAAVTFNRARQYG